ncbi:MAG: diguanylate cyclase [Rubrivivax sp.]|nr:diguanylate cyclase [Rubrivivax sp.]
MARRAWRQLHINAAECLVCADRALLLALKTGDLAAEAAARLARGFHSLYFLQPADAAAELRHAEALFGQAGDRTGQLLASAGVGRALWRSGQVQAALDHLLPMRDEGLRLLRHEQRGVLLNAIAGCYSAQGRSEEAFAYMYEALRGAGPARGHGFDAALHCNLSHELLQLGDHDEALAQVDRGIARCAGMRNARLESVLRINRVIGLTELGRAAEALPEVQRILALPATPGGRGVTALHFETLAIAALRAGDAALGADLLQRAGANTAGMQPDERVELAVAQALLCQLQGDLPAALAALDAVAALVDAPALRVGNVDGGSDGNVDGGSDGNVDGGSDGDGDGGGAALRACALVEQLRSQLHEALGDAPTALAAVRRWQAINAQRARLASRARYQAAVLQTELVKMQHKLEENDLQRRATERQRSDMVLANTALQRKIEEVQALQSALREQATHDALTGLFNRRHLNDTLPQLLAQSLREREPLTAVVIDLDHFKAVNDQHGHPAGDELLAAFGRLLLDGLRGSDIAFRYGGEEFCVLMPRTAADAACSKVQQLLGRWRMQRFALDTGELIGLSFSAGAADAQRAVHTPMQLLRAADDLLLAAKRAGRGRVLAAPVQRVV